MGHEVEKAALARQHEIVVTIDNPKEWEERIEKLKLADVAIDFSQPDQVVGNIHHCFDVHLPVVVGTTAWQDHFEEIKIRCLDEKAEKYGYQLSMAETHHIHKLDKPSGTAVKLANDIISVNQNYNNWSIDVPAEHTLYIKVTREGEVNGIHSVVAESPADKITLTHEAFNRQGFALGALAAAEFLVGKTGVFGMEDLFGE